MRATFIQMMWEKLKIHARLLLRSLCHTRIHGEAHKLSNTLQCYLLAYTVQGLQCPEYAFTKYILNLIQNSTL